jgi:lipopolysaccharide transport system ATP-binding protein
VRVVSESGVPMETVDIRQPVGIELEYEVLEAGHLFLPFFDLINESGIRILLTVDVDPLWRGRPRPTGRYVSTGWVPGNYLTEGMLLVGPAIMTLNPDCLQLEAPDAVAFRVIDCLNATDTARGDYTRSMPGIIRPLLQWTTRFTMREANPTNAGLRPTGGSSE